MTKLPPPPLEPLDSPEEVVAHAWKPLREIGKYSAVLVIVVVAFFMLKEKLAKLDWAKFQEGLTSISPFWIAAAVGLTALNYLILTGYDLIAVRYLKKSLPLHRVMIGAVVGYAMSNVLGWIFGGTAVRYRLYTSWGFSFKEIVAFVSILSLTFWLGMFLLAGVAFVGLPVKLPPEVATRTLFEPHIWGGIFLGVIVLYLLACTFWRRPIHWGQDAFQLPPVTVSIQQLIVSAADFALASTVLFVLLPHDTSNFSTVLVAYLVGMIITVTLHVPGGVGVLELALLSMLDTHKGAPNEKILASIVVFRVIYYLLPAGVAALLLVWNEWEMRRTSSQRAGVSGKVSGVRGRREVRFKKLGAESEISPPPES